MLVCSHVRQRYSSDLLYQWTGPCSANLTDAPNGPAARAENPRTDGECEPKCRANLPRVLGGAW